MLIKTIQLIEVSDFDSFISETYGKPYNFQQQDGCKERGIIKFSVPSKYTNDEDMNDSIKEEVNGDEMGVKFDTWLSKDTKVHNFKSDWENELFWNRNFYPDFETLINDLYSKGLLEKGDYIINIDW